MSETWHHTRMVTRQTVALNTQCRINDMGRGRLLRPYDLLPSIWPFPADYVVAPILSRRIFVTFLLIVSLFLVRFPDEESGCFTIPRLYVIDVVLILKLQIHDLDKMFICEWVVNNLYWFKSPVYNNEVYPVFLVEFSRDSWKNLTSIRKCILCW